MATPYYVVGVMKSSKYFIMLGMNDLPALLLLNTLISLENLKNHIYKNLSSLKSMLTFECNLNLTKI